MAKEISLKLFINRSTNKLLFAEAGKDFVDFLFGLLALPAATIVRLLSKKNMMGSLGKLHNSLQSLSDSYIEPNLDKNLALYPKILAPVITPNTLLLQDNVSPSSPSVSANPIFRESNCYYRCSRGFSSSRGMFDCTATDFTDVTATACRCGEKMTTQINYLNPSTRKFQTGANGIGREGYVKGLVTYMVMDDLGVTPMSTTSFVTQLNNLHIKEVGSVEEKVVNVRTEEGLKLLKASLESSTVLTDVFLLGKK